MCKCRLHCVPCSSSSLSHPSLHASVKSLSCYKHISARDTRSLRLHPLEADFKRNTSVNEWHRKINFLRSLLRLRIRLALFCWSLFRKDSKTIFGGAARDELENLIFSEVFVLVLGSFLASSSSSWALVIYDLLSEGKEQGPGVDFNEVLLTILVDFCRCSEHSSRSLVNTNKFSSFSVWFYRVCLSCWLVSRQSPVLVVKNKSTSFALLLAKFSSHNFHSNALQRHKKLSRHQRRHSRLALSKPK